MHFWPRYRPFCKLLMSAKTANCLLCCSKGAKIQILNYTDSAIGISTLLFKEREIQIFKFSNLGTSPSYLFRAKRSLGPKCTHSRPELETKGKYKFTFFFLFRNSHVMNYGRFQIRSRDARRTMGWGQLEGRWHSQSSKRILTIIIDLITKRDWVP